MNRRDCPIPGIEQEERNAIGGLDANEPPRRVLDERVTIADTAARTAGAHYDIGVHLVQGSDPVRGPEIFRPAGAEAMLQPIKLVESTDSINLMGSFVKHAGAYAGFWICEIMTCCLKFSSMASSSRTSVGRFTSVVIWSILSCSFNSA